MGVDRSTNVIRLTDVARHMTYTCVLVTRNMWASFTLGGLHFHDPFYHIGAEIDSPVSTDSARTALVVSGNGSIRYLLTRFEELISVGQLTGTVLH